MTTIPNLHSAPAAEEVPDGAQARPHLRLVRGMPRRSGGILTDLRLGGPVLDAVEPLRAIGIEPHDGLVQSPVDAQQRPVTVVGLLGQTFYLVELPRKVLLSAQEASQGVFAQLPNLFPDGSVVYVMGHRVDALPFVLSSVVARYRTVSVRFVPWLHLAGPRNDPPSPELLRAIFRLDDPVSRGPRPSRRRKAVTRADCDLIAGRLGQLLLMADDAKRRYADLVKAIAPSQELRAKAQAYWTGDLTVTATRFVEWADYQGPATLGRVVTVLVEDAPGHGDAEALVRLAAECELLDPERVNGLRRTVAGLGGEDER